MELLHGTSDAVLIVDGSARVAFANEGAQRVLRFAREDMVGRSVHDVLHGGGDGAECGDCRRLLSQDAAALGPTDRGEPGPTAGGEPGPTGEKREPTAGGEPGPTGEKREPTALRDVRGEVRRADGIGLPVFYNVFPYTADDGERRRLLSFRQRPERVAARRRLRRMMAVVEETPIYISLSNPDGNVVYVNKAGRKWLGVPEGVQPRGLRHTESVARAAAHKGVWQGERRQFLKEYPAARRTPDVLQTMVAHKNSAGEVEFYSTVAVDISEQRRLEQERGRLLAIVEDTPDVVATADAGGKVLYYNKAGRRLFQIRSDEDLARRGVGEGYSDWAARLLWEEGLPTAARDGLWRGETSVIDPDGREIPMLQVVLSHKNDTGEVEYYSTIMRDISDRKHMEEQLHYLATHDGLTGVLNRTRFKAALKGVLDKTRHGGPEGALLFIDLDNFKQINDRYGHHVGDELLRHVTRLVKSRLRDGDALARLGGDEFAVLLPHACTDDAAKIGRRLLDMVASKPLKWQTSSLQVSLSIGVAAYPEHADAVKDLLIAADMAMYESKRRGGHQVSVYRP